MPIQNNRYVAPDWKNNQAPAIDAAELQAISDALAAAQASNLSQDSLIAALQGAMSAVQTGKAQMETGSYVGTGTYGADNPCSITFSFTPKVVIVQKGYASGNTHEPGLGIFVDASVIQDYTIVAPVFSNISNQSGNGTLGWFLSYCKFSGNTLSWYNGYYAHAQLNLKNQPYTWLALA